MKTPSNYPEFPINWELGKAEYEKLYSSFESLKKRDSNAQNQQKIDRLIDEMATYPWGFLPDFGIVRIINRNDSTWTHAYSVLPDNYEGKVKIQLTRCATSPAVQGGEG